MNVFECPFSFYARKTPKDIAIISKEEKWSYLDCETVIEGMVFSLKDCGIKAQDPIAILPNKEFPTPVIFFALFRLGAIACPINTYYPLETLSQSLDELGAPLLLYPDGIKLPKIKQISLPFSKIFRKGKLSGPNFLEKNQRATYLFTSGTTAKPKIACHTLGNHYYSALGSNAYLPIEKGNRYHLSLPLYHIAGLALLFRTFLAGATVALSEHVKDITHLSLVSTQLKRLLNEKTISPYKHILIGGAQIPFSLYQKALNRNINLYPTYGMTEMSSQIATQFDQAFFSLGHPLPYRELQIGKGGEILVKGKVLFKGYLQGDGTFALPLNSEGYFATRDLGSYCAKTGLQVWGRKDRLFISGGENIHPEEIEKLLTNIEGIIRAEVRPIPDKEFGFRPTAYIESEKSYRDEELKDYLRSFLPKFKIPISFIPSCRARSHKG
ncbi:MAG: AMP-binding protein [Simkaniaceae bacterium]|nr:AMP-binding protein [Simkaniaceae bacterium]